LLPAAKTESLSQPTLLAVGEILQSRYRIVRQLGKGGMGAVYEAVDQRLDATVALKETFSVDDRLRRQFEQEARLLAQLNHPALPRVSDYFTEGDRAFLVMQFISGVDLAEIIAQQPGPFPRNQVVAWADQLLDALIYLHTRDRQIIHRDIKPHNLKLSSNGKIALLDFGLAKAQTADRSAGDTSNSIFGYTRRYAPLEQIQDQGTTPQSDIYALGATLYHLLTGVKPADALVRAAAAGSSMPDPLRPANEIHPAVGPELAAILCRAMAQNPEDRYPSATAFREALWRVGRSEDCETGDSISAHVIKTPRARAADPFDSYSILKPEEAVWFMPRQSRNPNAVVAAVLFVLLIGLVGTLYGYRLWIEASDSAPGHAKASPNQRVSEAAGQQNGQLNRADKMRLNASSIIGSAVAPSTEPGRKVGDADRKEADRKSTTPDRKAFVIDSANLDAQTVSLLPRERRGEVNPRINIPEARLPKAELKATDPTPAFHGLPAYGQQEAVVERQVLRTPDGTQIVKFSDGTTKVFRPGEKSAPGASAIAPQ
jgi:serine/threonine protein kinase